MSNLRFQGLRFHRTASEAFKDASYGAAIERPIPTFWQRLMQQLRECFA